MRARVESNGDLLAIFQADGGTPSGYGLIKLDKSSRLINLGQLGRRQSSRVIEVDPVTQRIHWEYAGSDAEPFFSYWRSSQQRLPNGNTLIVESATGRVFEVTRDRRIVWEYVNPIRGGERNKYIPIIPIITGAQRLPREALPFVRR